MKTKYFIYIWAILSGAYIAGLHTSALAKDNQEITKDPQKHPLQYMYDSYISEGLNYMENKDYLRAEIAFKKAQILFPQLPEAYINLGVLYIYTQGFNLKEALKLLNKAKDLIPTDYPQKDILLYNLGLCLYRQQDYQEAARYFYQSLKINPQFKEAAEGLRRSKLAIKKQISLFEPSQESLEQNTQETFFSQAQELLEEGSEKFKNKEIAQAINLIQKSISLNPNNPQAHYRLGVIYAYENRLREAIRCFSKAIEKNPLFTKAYINLGGVYGKLKNYPQALETLKKALSLDKDNPKIYYNLGMVYVAIGKKNIAKKYFKKARTLSRKTNNLLSLQKIPKL